MMLVQPCCILPFISALHYLWTDIIMEPAAHDEATQRAVQVPDGLMALADPACPIEWVANYILGCDVHVRGTLSAEGIINFEDLYDMSNDGIKHMAKVRMSLAGNHGGAMFRQKDIANLIALKRYVLACCYND